SPRDVSGYTADETDILSTLPPDHHITLDLAQTPREEMPLRSGQAGRDRSVEFALGLTEEQAQREAGRCLRCDLAYLCPTIKQVEAPAAAAPAGR
ncbi:MAG TPA: hypothetical protein VF916_01325, partial [Ktedonobacterales bacterium]